MVKRGRRWKRGYEAAQAASIHSDGKIIGSRMGAALFSGPNLLAVGFNIYTKTHPEGKQKTYDITIHAEQMALSRRRHYDINSNLTMYVWRETVGGIPAMSKPCVNCQERMRLAGVRKVRYVNEHGEAEEMRF